MAKRKGRDHWRTSPVVEVSVRRLKRIERRIGFTCTKKRGRWLYCGVIHKGKLTAGKHAEKMNRLDP